MRTPLIAANWKMHKTVSEAVAFAEELKEKLRSSPPRETVETLIAAPSTALQALSGALRDSPIALAAQNVHSEPRGAFTGELSAAMLADVGCRYVIVGHSERRSLFGETSAVVSAKAGAALSQGLLPIVCVGETLAEGEAGRTFDVIGEQLEESLAAVPSGRGPEIVIAYEPVWAIGTGRTATPELAQEAHAFIRAQLAKRFGEASAQIRIQYGGSVKPDSVAGIMAQPDIDGALVGGASLDPASFFAIIRFG